MPAYEFELYVSSGLKRRLPEKLEVVLRGVWRRHVSAYWNGCPWVM